MFPTYVSKFTLSEITKRKGVQIGSKFMSFRVEKGNLVVDFSTADFISTADFTSTADQQ